MTKREKIKQILTPIVKEILIECLSGGYANASPDDAPKSEKRVSKLNESARQAIINEHKRNLSSSFSGVEGKFKVSEGIHKLAPVAASGKSSSLTENILSKLDPEDYEDLSDVANDNDADIVISEMSSTWKKMMKE